MPIAYIRTLLVKRKLFCELMDSSKGIKSLALLGSIFSLFSRTFDIDIKNDELNEKKKNVGDDFYFFFLQRNLICQTYQVASESTSMLLSRLNDARTSFLKTRFSFRTLR